MIFCTNLSLHEYFSRFVRLRQGSAIPITQFPPKVLSGLIGLRRGQDQAESLNCHFTFPSTNRLSAVAPTAVRFTDHEDFDKRKRFPQNAKFQKTDRLVVVFDDAQSSFPDLRLEPGRGQARRKSS